MRDFLLTLLIGAVAGTIDVIPMIKMKLDKFFISSAFLYYLIVPFLIFNTELFHMPWWLKGGVIALAVAVPVIVVVAKEDKKTAPIMAVTSTVLGTLIGCAGHFLLH